jgi:hypothetical protein
MRKFSMLLLTAGLVFGGLAGCGDDADGSYGRYYDPGFRNNRNGTVEVVNNTSHDMLLFSGDTLGFGDIVGGVRAEDRSTINFSNKSDYKEGGYAILRAVRQTEFHAYKNQSLPGHTAMVTYGEGRRFTTNILPVTEGEYQYVVQNRSRDFGLELRENAPSGRKIAYLTKGEPRRIIRTASSSLLTLYPVWVAFNKQTKTIVTFTPTGVLDPHNIQPRHPNVLGLYSFPSGGSNIVNFPEIVLPFATIRVRNNASLLVIFRAGTTIRTPESGFQGIRSNTWETYEIEAEGGVLALNFAFGVGQAIVVPVRFEANPDALPVIENGYTYTVILNLKSGANPAMPESYEAWLVQDAKINTSDLLISI